LKSSNPHGDVFSPDALGGILGSRLGFATNTPFVVALSGGGDSVALLNALNEAGWRARAVHVDHRLHPDSGRWADACAALCSKLGVSCQIEQVRVTEIPERGYEAAAREARYARLREVLGAGEVLLTAHHQDDQAETVLLQMLRGAGVAGMSAMPAVAPFGPGRLARPLLSFRRAALRAYLAAKGVAWIEDESNQDLARSRNIVRHRVLPRMTEHWPGTIATLARSARHAAQAQTLLDELAAQDVAAVHCGRGGLAMSQLVRLSVARQANLIRFWLRRRGLALPSEAQLGEILRIVADRPRSGLAVVQWPGATVRRYRDSLVASDACVAPVEWDPQEWDLSAPLVIVAAGVRLRSKPATGTGLSLARLAGRPVSVRPRVGGEMCRLAGNRYRRSLKKLLQESAVPPWERARLPLLYIGDDLAAVGDRWVCEPYAALASEPSVRLLVEDVTGEFGDSPP
jgi:tRNA(Ile)-lysidine synthase